MPSSRSDVQSGGLFVADIPALENDLRGRVEPTVLVVRLAVEGAMYVVERVKRGIYSLSRLARWVHEGDIVVAAKGWQGSGDMDSDVDVNMETDDDCAMLDPLNWWQSAKIEEPPSDLGLGDEFAGLRMDMVFGGSQADVMLPEPSFVDVVQSRSQSVVPISQGVDVGDVFYAPLESQVNTDGMDIDHPAGPTEDAKQTPGELLEGMRDHYLQALYISKVGVQIGSRSFMLTNTWSRLPWPILLKVR